MNAIDRIATGESFTVTREDLQAALAEFEDRFGPLDKNGAGEPIRGGSLTHTAPGSSPASNSIPPPERL